MMTFKQFLKQKKLYGVDGSSEFNKLYNTDMNAIDPDLGEPSDETEQEVDDTEVDETKVQEVDDVEDTEVQEAELDEDGEGSSASVGSGTDGAMGGTTSADIASVPYGLTNKEDKESIGLIARMDAYL